MQSEFAREFQNVFVGKMRHAAVYNTATAFCENVVYDSQDVSRITFQLSHSRQRGMQPKPVTREYLCQFELRRTSVVDCSTQLIGVVITSNT